MKVFSFIGLAIILKSSLCQNQNISLDVVHSIDNFANQRNELVSKNCGNPAIKPHLRIIGGYETIPHSFPWQLYITDLKYLCGATLISSEWIITAAHCVSLMNESKLKANLGAHNLNLDEFTLVSSGIDKIVKHPKFNSVNFYHFDIALIKLKNPVRFTSYISPICLPVEQLNFDSAIVTGWGLTNNINQSRRLLRQVRVDILDPINCPVRSDNLICAGNKEVVKGITFYKIRDSCQGDSGGPMIVEKHGKYYLVGITSWGVIGCTGTSGYTKVSNFLDWINSVMYENQ